MLEGGRGPKPREENLKPFLTMSVQPVPILQISRTLKYMYLSLKNMAAKCIRGIRDLSSPLLHTLDIDVIQVITWTKLSPQFLHSPKPDIPGAYEPPLCGTHKLLDILTSFPGSPRMQICIVGRAWYLFYISMT